MGRAGPGYETMEERGDVPTMGIFLTAAAKGKVCPPKMAAKVPFQRETHRFAEGYCMGLDHSRVGFVKAAS